MSRALWVALGALAYPVGCVLGWALATRPPAHLIHHRKET